MSPPIVFIFFFFNDTATTEIYTLSLHDALPISAKKEYQASPTAAAASANPVDDLLHKFTAGKSVAPMASADSLEFLSSLDRVELMCALESTFHVELNETAFANAKTAVDVERLLQQPSARKTDYLYPRWTQ